MRFIRRILKFIYDQDLIIVEILVIIIILTWLLKNQTEQDLAINGIEYGKMKKELMEIQDKNLILESLIDDAMSYRVIAGEAAQLGFTNDNNVIYIRR